MLWSLSDLKVSSQEIEDYCSTRIRGRIRFMPVESDQIFVAFPDGRSYPIDRALIERGWVEQARPALDRNEIGSKMMVKGGRRYIVEAYRIERRDDGYYAVPASTRNLLRE